MISLRGAAIKHNIGFGKLWKEYTAEKISSTNLSNKELISKVLTRSGSKKYADLADALVNRGETDG